jgi:hypothetical protein
MAESFEDPCEVLRGLKTAGDCYVDHSCLPGVEHLLCSCDSRTKNILVRCISGRPPKHLASRSGSRLRSETNGGGE